MIISYFAAKRKGEKERKRTKRDGEGIEEGRFSFASKEKQKTCVWMEVGCVIGAAV